MKELQEQNMESRILEAAERLFLENGFGMTSTTAIARQAGCNQALVHYYFRTKEKLFVQIFERKVRLFMETFTEAEQQGQTFEDKIRRMVRGHFAILMQNPKLPLFIITEISRKPDKIRALKDAMGGFPEKLLTRLQVEIDKEAESGKIRPVPALTLILNIITLNAGVFLMQPVMQAVLEINEEEMKNLISQRGIENADTILNSLKSI